jgi:ferredoxin-nitrite reductase
MNTVELFKRDIMKFREMTDKFYNKEISVKEYKGFSGGFGSYAQKGGEKSMLRLRMAGGRLTKEKLGFIAKSLKQYPIDKLHFTTCQTVQLHNLPGNIVGDLMEEALDYNIITKGGGGDFPRNIMVSPLSGVTEGEYFDVLPYGEAAGNYLLDLIDQIKMPRKLKMAFSNTASNVVHATFRDLGFVAREDGTFDVYSAGGLGNNARIGVCVAEGVDPSRILYYIRAMVNTFMKY